MSYKPSENTFRIDADTINIVEDALNKGYCVKRMDYNNQSDVINILFGVRKKPENWPESIKLTDAQIHSLEAILSCGQKAKIDLASVIMVMPCEKCKEPLDTIP